MKKITVIIIAVCMIALLLSAGCINSNEFIPVTPSEVYPAIHMDHCLVRIEGKMYRTLNMETCERLVVNQTNWVMFCPEFTFFPICKVEP